MDKIRYCDFCKNSITESEYSSLIRKKINTGDLGDIDIDVFISKDSDEYSLIEMDAHILDSKENILKVIKAKEYISYCPMCGAKLNIKKE